MTEKSKAEEFVRNKFPELRELRFGCYVKVNVMGTWMGLIIDDCEVERNGDDGVKIDSDCYSGNELEIIGHPITLNYWLMALNGKISDSVNYYTGEMLTVYTDVADIDFNLTTGQPNSEEDYRTFNSIVGVNE